MNHDFDDLLLTDIARLWPAISAIKDATEEQADAALKEIIKQRGKKELFEALFQLGAIFREYDADKTKAAAKGSR